MTASLTVAQVPTEVPEVIVGQIHGAADISSVPFVMVFYDGGTVKAVVKQEQSGNAHTDVPLLDGVPVGAPFDYSITDGGDGTLTVTATYQGRTVSGSAPMPAAFAGATVRFQAGAYQQAPSAVTRRRPTTARASPSRRSTSERGPRRPPHDGTTARAPPWRGPSWFGCSGAHLVVALSEHRGQGLLGGGVHRAGLGRPASRCR